MLPFEKDTILFYQYYFEGRKDPVDIMAPSRKQADELIKAGMQAYEIKENYIDVRVFTPVAGVTRYDKDGVTMVWVGLDNSASGFLTEPEFEIIKEKFQ